jgi:hypothetical protein
MVEIERKSDPGIWGGRVSGRDQSQTNIDRRAAMVEKVLGPGHGLEPSKSDVYSVGKVVSLEEAAAEEHRIKGRLDDAVDAENRGIQDEGKGLPPCKRARYGK